MTNTSEGGRDVPRIGVAPLACALVAIGTFSASAQTAPRTVIPTTPTANPLFQGTVPSKGFGPDALGAYTDPQVLTVASAFTWQLPSGDNALLSVPAGNNPVLQTPGANPQRPAAKGVPSSDDARRDTDTPSRTL